MRTSKTVRSLNFNLENLKQSKQIFSKKGIFYILLLVFMVGLMYGSVLVQSRSQNVLSLLDIIQKTTTQNKINHSFLSIMISSFSSSILFLLVIFLSGFSSIGQVTPFIVLFVKGLGLGSSVSYFYITYGFKGIGYVLVIVLPVTIIVLFSLILSSKEAIKLSNLLFKTFLGNNLVTLKTIKLYIIKNIVILVFLLFSAILDSILSVLFANMFNLK